MIAVYYGSRWIAVSLERDRQLVANRKAVQRLMCEMDIAGMSPGLNLSRRNPKHQVYPYLLRNRVAARPNHNGRKGRRSTTFLLSGSGGV